MKFFNVFILCCGRCGSLTFSMACSHINNYTSGHETKTGVIGKDRIFYKNNHIEIDNRLCWFLNRIDNCYNNNPFYVHLIRNKEDCVRSLKKGPRRIILAYAEILQRNKGSAEELSFDYYDLINENISKFLENKTNKMIFKLENAKNDFIKFWNNIKAEGDLDKSLNEWDVKYNETIKK